MATQENRNFTIAYECFGENQHSDKQINSRNKDSKATSMATLIEYFNRLVKEARGSCCKPDVVVTSRSLLCKISKTEEVAIPEGYQLWVKDGKSWEFPDGSKIPKTAEFES